MNIQSLSITVPTPVCVNSCKFCVSKMHANPYKRDIFASGRLKSRLMFAASKNIDTIILTAANGEALQNKDFLKYFSQVNEHLVNPFVKIELQTTGVLLDDETLLFLYHTVGVSTISLSVSNIFKNERNLELMQTKHENYFSFPELAKSIKDHGFNLRLSLNLVVDYAYFTPKQIFDRATELGANQITFRELYVGETENKITKWTRENKLSRHDSGNGKITNVTSIENFIRDHGEMLYSLPFGATVFQ